ncbi:hypothetical protein VUR80DRAFT_2807 [Thermomyces stellatus]
MPPAITTGQTGDPNGNTDRTMATQGPKLQRFGSEAASETSESDYPRGRPRDRNPAKQALMSKTNQGDTGESGTFRGRTRWRSTSLTRNPSSGARTAVRAPSPARRVLVRVAMKHRHRSQSPSRSRSRDSEWRRGIRRRERTVSRSIGVEDDVRNSPGRQAGR